MEQWQLEALQALLATETQEVEAGSRVYVSSRSYGNSRYHLLDRFSDGIQVEQIDMGEKWSRRVSFSTDEVPAVLKTLLLWYWQDVKKAREASLPAPDNDELGNLDDPPF